MPVSFGAAQSWVTFPPKPGIFLTDLEHYHRGSGTPQATQCSRAAGEYSRPRKRSPPLGDVPVCPPTVRSRGHGQAPGDRALADDCHGPAQELAARRHQSSGERTVPYCPRCPRFLRRHDGRKTVTKVLIDGESSPYSSSVISPGPGEKILSDHVLALSSAEPARGSAVPVIEPCGWQLSVFTLSGCLRASSGDARRAVATSPAANLGLAPSLPCRTAIACSTVCSCILQSRRHMVIRCSRLGVFSSAQRETILTKQ